MLAPWPHQIEAVDRVLALLAQGETRICVCGPTGSGKTVTMAMLLQRWLAEGLTCGLYTNRRLLTDQLSRVMDGFGLEHGFRAADRGHSTKHLLQIISIQTEASRAGLKRRKCRACGQPVEAGKYVCACGQVAEFTPVFRGKRNIIDEAHANATPQMIEIMDVGREQGGAYVGFTATPLDLGHCYDKLVLAGTPSKLRRTGVLVPAIHYAPDEPDLRPLGRLAEGQDLTEKQAVSAIMRNGILGRVLEWFFKLNPRRRPSILFAPGVKESLWFAEQFTYPHLREAQFQHYPAVPAAHIDGEEVWMDGEFKASSEATRDAAILASRTGRIQVICNRYVMREGVDMPWVRHIILATVFGSLQSFLQSCGRGMRTDRGEDTIHTFGPKAEVTVADHGGNYHRHGSLNADREWSLEYTNAIASGLRASRLREKKCRHCGAKLGFEPKCQRCGCTNEVEQSVCPECMRVIFGRRCPCGYVLPEHRSRRVIQTSGEIRIVDGDVFKPRRLSKAANGVQRWVKCYFRSLKSKNRMTFNQAFALFAKENYWSWPHPTWPYMPVRELDRWLPVADVPYDRLVPAKQGVRP